MGFDILRPPIAETIFNEDGIINETWNKFFNELVGLQQFTYLESIVTNHVLVGYDISSTDYEEGVSGWRIASDDGVGVAEFNIPIVSYADISGDKPDVDADETATVITGGLVTTGTIQVNQGGSGTAGITGNTSGDSAVRFWAGGAYEDRSSAPFRVTQEGAVTAENLAIGDTGAFLQDFANDDKLTPVEKFAMRREWSIVATDYVNTVDRATTLGLTTEASTLTAAFDVWGTYLNDGDAWTSPTETPITNAMTPAWLQDANILTTTAVSRSTFNTNSNTYLAALDVTKAAIGVEMDSNVGSGDETATVIAAGLITTGTIQVNQGGAGTAGMTGNTSGDTAVRFWAGGTFANRTSAPFRVYQNGTVVATALALSGTSSYTGEAIGTSYTVADVTPGFPSDENLVGYWSMDEGYGTTVIDSSGNGNDGTLSGGNWVAGVSGTMVAFDYDADDKITISDFAELDFGTGDFSISCWAKIDSFINQGSTWNCILYRGSLADADAGEYGFGYIDDGYVKFHIGGYANPATFETDLTDSTLHHIVGVRESGVTSIYVDTVKGTDGTNSASATGATDFYIGGDEGVKRHLDGSVDEVRIYNKALTAQEIRALYLNPGGMKAPHPGTIAFINTTYPSDISTLEAAIADGKLETWYTSTDPQPTWSGSDANHTGDMWWNTSTKKLKRYSGTAWSADIEDQKAIDAYDNASTAQDTADGKRRVFVVTPSGPYDAGDLWDRGSDEGEGVWVCRLARTSGFDIGNWHAVGDVTNENTAADTDAVYGAPSSVLAGWRYGATTYINGGDIYTGTVTAGAIAAGAITTSKINGFLGAGDLVVDFTNSIIYLAGASSDVYIDPWSANVGGIVFSGINMASGESSFQIADYSSYGYINLENTEGNLTFNDYANTAKLHGNTNLALSSNGSIDLNSAGSIDLDAEGNIIIDCGSGDHTYFQVAGTNILIVDTSGLYPVTDSSRDIGTSSYYFRNTYTDTLYTNDLIWHTNEGGDIGTTSLHPENVYTKFINFMDGTGTALEYIRCGSGEGVELRFFVNATEVMNIDSSGDMYLLGIIDADDWAEHSPVYMGTDAIELLQQMQPKKDSEDKYLKYSDEQMEKLNKCDPAIRAKKENLNPLLSDKWGQIDHSTLPEGVRIKTSKIWAKNIATGEEVQRDELSEQDKKNNQYEYFEKEIPARSLGKLIQVIQRAVVLLADQVDNLTQRIDNL